MIVEVKPLFKLREVLGTSCLKMEVSDGTTVEGLMMKLVETSGPEFRKAFIDSETGEIGPQRLILLNEKPIFQLPDEIHTLLKDGDVISMMIVLRGG